MGSNPRGRRWSYTRVVFIRFTSMLDLMYKYNNMFLKIFFK